MDPVNLPIQPSQPGSMIQTQRKNSSSKLNQAAPHVASKAQPKSPRQVCLPSCFPKFCQPYENVFHKSLPTSGGFYSGYETVCVCYIEKAGALTLLKGRAATGAIPSGPTLVKILLSTSGDSQQTQCSCYSWAAQYTVVYFIVAKWCNSTACLHCISRHVLSHV